jgi:hypothetical protein
VINQLAQMHRKYIKAAFALLVASQTTSALAATISGQLVKPGLTCARIALADGRIVALMGIARNSAAGKSVRLEGQWVKKSTCQQGPTFQVLRDLTQAPPPLQNKVKP